MENTETNHDILKEIAKSRSEKIAMETANEKIKNDFARELLEEKPVMYDIPYAFARKKPFNLRMRENWQRIITRLKVTLGTYDKQEF
jgi:hypothetical protein